MSSQALIDKVLLLRSNVFGKRSSDEPILDIASHVKSIQGLRGLEVVFLSEVVLSKDHGHMSNQQVLLVFMQKRLESQHHREVLSHLIRLQTDLDFQIFKSLFPQDVVKRSSLEVLGSY